jgi:predicted DNA-binding protein
MMQTVTIELPERLYRSANRLAHATQRPLADILRESLSHTLPPLDDVSAEETEILLRLSTLDDSTLWREAQVSLPLNQQTELEELLVEQSDGRLLPDKQARLEALQDEYGRLLVHKAHAWLLLARRGYKTPIQTP